MAQDDGVQVSVPYVAFRTFLTAIESLEQGLPKRIDRSVWPTFSGASQNQLINAFKFLGLIDKDGYTQPPLEQLVENKEARKTILQDLLKKSYPHVISLELTKASPMQLEEAIREYGVKGSTLQKAISFFLQACQFAEIPLGQLLINKTRTISGTRRKKSTKSRETLSDTKINNVDRITKNSFMNEEIPMSPQKQGTSKTIELKSGGTLTLTISVDVFAMTKGDREFVFELIDKLHAYEQEDKELELEEE